MALKTNTDKGAALAEPTSTSAATGTLSTNAQLAKTPDEPEKALKTDEDGKPVNEGDVNAKPNSEGPISPIAKENEKTVPELKTDAVDQQNRVYVRNLRGVAFRQPSSGVWIGGGHGEYLINDDWLENQIAAGLLKKGRETEGDREAVAAEAGQSEA